MNTHLTSNKVLGIRGVATYKYKVLVVSLTFCGFESLHSL